LESRKPTKPASLSDFIVSTPRGRAKSAVQASALPSPSTLSKPMADRSGSRARSQRARNSIFPCLPRLEPFSQTSRTRHPFPGCAASTSATDGLTRSVSVGLNPVPSSCNRTFICSSSSVQVHVADFDRSTEQNLTHIPQRQHDGRVCKEE